MDTNQRKFLKRVNMNLDDLARTMPKFQCSNPNCNDSISVPMSIILSLNWFPEEKNLFLCPECLEDYLKSDKKWIQIIN